MKYEEKIKKLMTEELGSSFFLFFIWPFYSGIFTAVMVAFTIPTAQKKWKKKEQKNWMWTNKMDSMTDAREQKFVKRNFSAHTCITNKEWSEQNFVELITIFLTVKAFLFWPFWDLIALIVASLEDAIVEQHRF